MAATETARLISKFDIFDKKSNFTVFELKITKVGLHVDRQTKI